MTLPVFLTPEQVAEKLQVTTRSVYNWLRSGKLKGLRAGGSWRVTEDDLMAFLTGTAPEPEKKPARSKK